tara:strand:- start:44146 stop:45162 length:1017 start_codon:yes stop_codon:yes gene_type:complete
MKNRKFYITGGAGFIGRHFNNHLKDYQRISIDLREQQLVNNQVLGDIRNIEEIRNSIADSNTILHLAASHYDFEKDYFKTNVEGTRNLLQVATEKNIDHFVFYSSVAVYGVKNLPANEESQKMPENDYGRSKLEAEGIIKKWVDEKKGRKALIIRPSVVFGSHNYGNIFNLMRNIDRGRNVQIGNKSVIKSIAFVENLIDATLYLMQNVDSDFEVFNYADTPHLTNFEISHNISDGLGRKGAIKIPYGLAIALGGVFDMIGGLLNKEMVISVKRVQKFCTSTHFEAEKVKKFGFKPAYTTKEGLKKTAVWFDENRDTWQHEYDNLKKLFKTNYGISIE